MEGALVLMEAFKDELRANLAQLIQISVAVAVFHAIGFLVTNGVLSRIQFYAALRGESLKVNPDVSLLFLASAAMLLPALEMLYIPYCLYLAAANEYVPYLALTGQPIPWPVSIFFS